MNEQRAKIAKLGRISSVRAKALILAVVVLTIGVVSVAIGSGFYSAVAVGAFAFVLLMQIAIAWKRARVETERFQQLRKRIDGLARQVAAVSSANTGKHTPRPANVKQEGTPSHKSDAPSPQQMFDLQRELDYLLWRASSVRASDATVVVEQDVAPVPASSFDSTEAR